MQDLRGHCIAIMSVSGDFTNVGIAAVPETSPNAQVGPPVVTDKYCHAYEAYPDHYNRLLIQLTCTAHYSNRAEIDVTSAVDWFEDPAHAEIESSRYLTTYSVTTGQNRRITASSGSQKSDLDVPIRNTRSSSPSRSGKAMPWLMLPLD